MFFFFVLIDTDCVPTSLFKIEELARLMWRRDTDVDMVDDEAKILSAVDPPCPSMVMLCTVHGNQSRNQCRLGDCNKLPSNKTICTTGLSDRFLLRAPFGQYGPVAAFEVWSVYHVRLAPWTRGGSNRG